MELHAVMVQLQQIEILGSNVCDQSQFPYKSKAMGGKRYVSTTEADYSKKNNGLCQLPAEVSDANTNQSSNENIDPKAPTRKKKSRTKAKLGRKFTKEVFWKDKSSFDAIQPYVWMKWARVKPIENNTLYSFVNGEWRGISCFGSNVQYQIRRGRDANSRKGMPIWKKKVKSPKSIVSMDPKENFNDTALSGKNCIDFPGSEVRGTNFNVEAQKVQPSKDHLHAAEGFQHLFIDFGMVKHAFSASYRLQVASEIVQQATGYPIAEFERLIFSASPFIASSFSPQAHDGCSYDEPSCSPCLCTHQMPNISLQSIWKWYEEPGNYGLKVTVDDLPKHTRCFADTISFHAHFVPLLSAVQLFGHQNLSSSVLNQNNTLGINDEEAKPKPSFSCHPIFMACLKTSFKGNNTLGNTVDLQSTNHISDVYIDNQKEPSRVGQPALLCNADLIFEFFESEQPQRRAPLYNKITELTSSGGTPDNKMFGDPSKLKCTSLDDLHPASWFSVAWYPIYRIPEGKLRAAFLTYHSLGYMAQRCMRNDAPYNKVGIILPIIGLQSYNAQGELWFSPNSQANSSYRELTCTLVKERLKTLEENALVFARGMVHKDNMTVPNRQPDYEFFMSRKH